MLVYRTSWASAVQASDASLEGDEVVTFGVARPAHHDVVVGLLVGERDGRHDVGAEVDAQDRDSAERQRDADDDVHEERRQLGDIARQRVRDRLAQVVEDPPTSRSTQQTSRRPQTPPPVSSPRKLL